MECARYSVYGKSTTKFAQQPEVGTRRDARSNGVAFCIRAPSVYLLKRGTERERERKVEEEEEDSSWRKLFQILSRESSNEITRESLSLSLSVGSRYPSRSTPLILISGETEDLSSSTVSLNHTTNLAADVAIYQGRDLSSRAKRERFVISIRGLPGRQHRKLRAESSPDETWQTLVKLHGGLVLSLVGKIKAGSLAKSDRKRERERVR